MNDRKMTKRGGAEEIQAKTREETERKNIQSTERGCGLVCLLFRGDPVRYRILYRDISCYDIPYHAMLQYTILWILSYRGKRSIDYVPNAGSFITMLRDIIPISLIWRTDINIVPHRNICRHRTPVCTTSREKDNLHIWRHPLKVESNHQPSTDDDSIKPSVVLRCQKPRAKKEGQRVYMKRTSICCCCCCCCCCCFHIKPFILLYDISSTPGVLNHSS